MDRLSLMTLILAAVTFFLAVAAFWSIWQNYVFRKKDKKDRLLSDIIEWAIDVARTFEPVNIPDLTNDKDAAKSWPFLDNQRKKLNTLQLLGARSLAMCIIAEKIGLRLKVVVENASKKLENQQGMLWEFKRWGDTRQKTEKVDTEFLKEIAEKVSQNNSELYTSALEVIRDVTDLRSESG